jgi:hypothetical protein
MELSADARKQLEEILRDEPDVVRAVWKAGDSPQLVIALDDAGGEVDVYRARIQGLAVAVLPALGRYRASLACGPEHGIASSARGGTVVYERDTA